MRLALERHEMAIGMGSGEVRWLPYVVRSDNELLIDGAAWTALVIGSKSVLAGSMQLCFLARRYPKLAHENRCLRAAGSIQHMAYKLDRHIFITTEGAELVVRWCCSGVLSKKHHSGTPIQIRAKIDALRRALMDAFTAACDVLVKDAPVQEMPDAPRLEAPSLKLRLNTATAEICDATGRVHTLPYAVTPMYEVLVQASAWVASLAGCKNSTAGSKKFTDIVKKAPQLFHSGRVLKNQPLTAMSYKVDKNIYLTIAGAKEVVNLCNCGLLGKRHYTKGGEADNGKIMRTIINIKTAAIIKLDTERARIINRLRTDDRIVFED